MGENGEGGYAQPRGPRADGAPKSAMKGGGRANANEADAGGARPARPAAKRPAGGGGGAGAQRRRPAGKAAAKGGAARRQRMVQRPLEMEVDDEPRGKKRDNLHPMRMEL